MKRPAQSWAFAVVPLMLLGVAGCTGHPSALDSQAALRAKLAAHRDQQIERLEAYAVAGHFPHNFTSHDGLHMFRDADGNLCAVANLVHLDGRDDLVETTARERNDLAIADVHDGPMMGWILQSGFTQEELARIQLPNMRLTQRQLRPDPTVPAPRPPSPVDAVAAAPRPLRMTVDVRDEDAMMALVRAHVARVAVELRSHRDESLAVAVTRAASSPPVRVASR